MLNKKWLIDQILSVSDNYYMQAHFYNLLYMMCINRFIWKNVPANIDIDFIEKELANQGELAFINHEKYGYQITYCVGDMINMYNRPLRYLCFTANNVINEYFDADDIVIIRNNKLSEPSKDFIARYSSMLGEIQKTKEVNLNAQKTPILIQCDESQLLTMKNIYADFEGNAPVIFSTKQMNYEDIKVLKTDAPYLLDKLQSEKVDTLNECLNFMGIKTVSDKKERMFTKEVEANNDLVNICLSMFLNTRLQAIKEIKEKFGLSFEIELAEYVKEGITPKEVIENE
jgi:hypothetical protein